MPKLVFANSVDYARHTGGWVYNSRVMRELSALGWMVEPLDLPAGFPRPDNQARSQSAKLLAALPKDTIVVADQICFSPLANILPREAARLRLVMIFHHPIARESGLPEADRARFADLERCVLAACALIVATSQTTAETLNQDYGVEPGRIVVAPPGIDCPPPAELPSVADVPRLLSVGAVIERKGYHILVDALAGLSDTPWQLDIVGDLDRAPDYVERLQARIAGAGLAGRVVLKGGLSAAELETCWQSAHAYIAASQHEGYGMAIAEAIARGLPTVTTHSGAIGDWLDSSAAIIVPHSSRGALRAAIGRVLSEPSLRQQLRQGALVQAATFAIWADTALAVHERLVQL